MNESVRVPSHSASQTAPESSARPKVMRRPARFSGSSHVAEILPITPRVEAHYIPLPTQEPTPAVPPKSWQDDGRFGFALLVMLILVNIVVGFALTHKQPSNPALVEANRLIPAPIAAKPAEADAARDVWQTPPFVHVLDEHAQPIGQ